MSRAGLDTWRGGRFADPVREALLHIRFSIRSREAFNPTLSSRRFRIILSDFMKIFFLRKNMDRLAAGGCSGTVGLPPLSMSPMSLPGQVDCLTLQDLFTSSRPFQSGSLRRGLICVRCLANMQLSPQLTFEKYVSRRHVTAKRGHAQTIPRRLVFFLSTASRHAFRSSCGALAGFRQYG